LPQDAVLPGLVWLRAGRQYSKILELDRHARGKIRRPDLVPL